MAARKKNDSTFKTLAVNHLGQIREGTVDFGDFTLIVGAQASGKSIFLQMFKLLIDRHQIFDTLQTMGYDWSGKFDRLLDLYFGESMSGLWKENTVLKLDGKVFQIKDVIQRRGVREAMREGAIFYVPAQRVVTITQGWPRNFQNYDIGDPYVLKAFSESLRQLMEKEFSNGSEDTTPIFPRPNRMTEAIRKQIKESIFHEGTVELDKSGLRRRFLLRIGDSKLPFMTWSAGQKEFMPLLLSLYYLNPAGNIQKRKNLDWVVIEEPEMGLHPLAIQTVLLLGLQLMQRGYKVVISTHSPVLLELVWAIQNIKAAGGHADLLYELFSLKKAAFPQEVFITAVNQKNFKTYFFHRQSDNGVRIKDISTLDAGSEDPAVSNWGGLTAFAERAAEVVSKLPER